MQYIDYLKRSILATNKLGITEINELEHLHSRNLHWEDYPKIKELANEKNIDAIKHLPTNAERTTEYLAIFQFSDQLEKRYLVTAYDNELPTQDPQLIDLFKL